LRFSDPIYKALKELGYFKSNSEAKRAVEEGSVSFLHSENKHSVVLVIKPEHTVKLLALAAKDGLYLKVGKTQVEKLDYEEG
jgi:hypothetical protein